MPKHSIRNSKPCFLKLCPHYLQILTYTKGPLCVLPVLDAGKYIKDLRKIQEGTLWWGLLFAVIFC